MMKNSSTERAEAEDVSVPVPDANDLRIMGCPEEASEAVRERLKETPPEERVTMDQIQGVIEEVMDSDG